jgi:hypothetical protein
VSVVVHPFKPIQQLSKMMSTASEPIHNTENMAETVPAMGSLPDAEKSDSPATTVETKEPSPRNVHGISV